MSGGGLLLNALGGAVGAGADEAVRQNTMTREEKKNDLNYQRQQSLAALQAKSSRENSMYEAARRSQEGDKDRASRERIARLSESSRAPTKAWEPITQKDMEGNVTVIGKFNAVTGEKEMFGSGAGGEGSVLDAAKTIPGGGKAGVTDGGGNSPTDYRQRLSGAMDASQQQGIQQERLSKQQGVYNTWLSNIGEKIGALKGVKPAGLLQSPQMAAPSQNELDQYLNMLNDVAAKGTPEQKAEAERLFQQLTR